MSRSWIKRLKTAARWRLPPKEAEEVIADYTELLFQDARTREELDRELGKPVQAVRLVSQPKEYHTWLAVFIVLAFCLLLPALALFLEWFDWLNYTWMSTVLLVLGLVLSWGWFQRQGRRIQGGFPKAVPAFLFLLVLGMAAAWLMLWLAFHYLSENPLYRILWDLMLKRGHTWRPAVLLESCGLLAAVLGLTGLVKARTGDRRWRAVYVLGLAVMALCISSLALLSSMSLDNARPNWWVPYFWRFVFFSVVGLVGAGASLC